MEAFLDKHVLRFSCRPWIFFLEQWRAVFSYPVENSKQLGVERRFGNFKMIALSLDQTGKLAVLYAVDLH